MHTTNSDSPMITESAVNDAVHDVHVLSSFRSKARSELKSMAKRIEKQAGTEKAQQMVQQAQEDAKIKQDQCNKRGAKIAELAHTIECFRLVVVNNQ